LKKIEEIKQILTTTLPINQKREKKEKKKAHLISFSFFKFIVCLVVSFVFYFY